MCPRGVLQPRYVSKNPPLAHLCLLSEYPESATVVPTTLFHGCLKLPARLLPASSAWVPGMQTAFIESPEAPLWEYQPVLPWMHCLDPRRPHDYISFLFVLFPKRCCTLSRKGDYCILCMPWPAARLLVVLVSANLPDPHMAAKRMSQQSSPQMCWG